MLTLVRITVTGDDPMGCQYRDKIYSNYYSYVYSRLNTLESEAYAQISKNYIKLYSRYFPSDKNVPIVDCGCGVGYFMYALETCGFSNVIGCDVSRELVDIAGDRGLRVVQEDAVSFLSRHKEEFGLIVATDILEHLYKDELFQFVESVSGALLAGGRAIFSIPNANSPFAARLRYKDLTHELSFTEESISTVLYATGLTPVYVGEELLFPVNIQQLLAVLVRKCFRGIYRLYMMSEMGMEARYAPLSFKLIAIAQK